MWRQLKRMYIFFFITSYDYIKILFPHCSQCMIMNSSYFPFILLCPTFNLNPLSEHKVLFPSIFEDNIVGMSKFSEGSVGWRAGTLKSKMYGLSPMGPQVYSKIFVLKYFTILVLEYFKIFVSKGLFQIFRIFVQII